MRVVKIFAEPCGRADGAGAQSWLTLGCEIARMHATKPGYV
jgi:hypothetical protein